MVVLVRHNDKEKSERVIVAEGVLPEGATAPALCFVYILSALSYREEKIKERMTAF